MGLLDVIDKVFEPITKKIFPPDKNRFEATNYVEYQKCLTHSALSAVSLIVKAFMVIFFILMLISFFWGR
jgi:hypothetical protein